MTNRQDIKLSLDKMNSFFFVSRNIIVLGAIFFFLTLAELQAVPCYLFVGESGSHKKNYLEQMVKPILLKHLNIALDEVPIYGLSSKELKSACRYDVSLHESDKTLTLSISSAHASPTLQVTGISHQSGPEGIIDATLRAVYGQLNVQQQKLLCKEFFQSLADKCSDSPRILIVYQSGSNAVFEKDILNAQDVLFAALESLVKKNGTAETLKEHVFLKEAPSESNLLPHLRRHAATAIVIQIQGERSHTPTSMWQGIVSLSMSLHAFRIQAGKMVEIGSYSPKLQRRPIRKWSESSDAKAEEYRKTAIKLTRKWSKRKLQAFLKSL